MLRSPPHLPVKNVLQDQMKATGSGMIVTVRLVYGSVVQYLLLAQ